MAAFNDAIAPLNFNSTERAALTIVCRLAKTYRTQGVEEAPEGNNATKYMVAATITPNPDWSCDDITEQFDNVLHVSYARPIIQELPGGDWQLSCVWYSFDDDVDSPAMTFSNAVKDVIYDPLLAHMDGAAASAATEAAFTALQMAEVI